MPPTPRTSPYQPGEPVRFLVQRAGGGTCLTNGRVVDAAPVDSGGFRIDTIYLLVTAPDGIGTGRFYVAADGRCDALSAGHLWTCVDCAGDADVQAGTGTWRGPRDELICRDRTGCAARQTERTEKAA